MSDPNLIFWRTFIRIQKNMFLTKIGKKYILWNNVGFFITFFCEENGWIMDNYFLKNMIKTAKFFVVKNEIVLAEGICWKKYIFL